MAADPLLSYLAERDTPCPGCGYNLRGLQGPSCPECGAALAMRVSLAEPRMGLFLTVLVVLSAGLGFNLFILGWGLWSWLRWGYPTPGELWPLIVGTVVLGAGTLLALRRRRWLRERSGLGRAGIIAGCLAVTLGTVAMFFAVVAV